MDIIVGEIDRQLIESELIGGLPMDDSKEPFFNRFGDRRRDIVIDSVLRQFRKARSFIRNIIWPYNVIKIRTVDRSYSDPQHILIHASMQILVDFVEKEKPFEMVEWWSHTPDHAAAADTICWIYDGWTNDEWWASNNHGYDDLDEQSTPYNFMSIEPDRTIIPGDPEFMTYEMAIDRIRMFYPDEVVAMFEEIAIRRSYRVDHDIESSAEVNWNHRAWPIMDQFYEELDGFALKKLVSIHGFLWT